MAPVARSGRMKPACQGASPGESAAGESSGSADEQEAARPPVQAEASQGADGAARVKRVRAKAAKPERGGKPSPGDEASVNNDPRGNEELRTGEAIDPKK